MKILSIRTSQVCSLELTLHPNARLRILEIGKLDVAAHDRGGRLEECIMSEMS